MWRLCAGVNSLLIDRWVVGREQVRHGCKLVLSWHGEVGGGSLVRGLGPACVSDGSNTGEPWPQYQGRGPQSISLSSVLGAGKGQVWQVGLAWRWLVEGELLG